MIRYIVDKFRRLQEHDWGKIAVNLLWIYQYVKRYRFQITVYMALSLSSTAFGLVSSVASKNLIDAVTGFNTSSVGWAFSIFAGLGVGRIFLNVVSGRISLLIQSKVSNEIRADIFDQVMYTQWESVSEYSTGDLLVRISGDTGMISNNVLSFIPSVVSTLVNFTGAFAIVFYYDHWMALIALAGAPMTVLTSHYRLAKMQEFQRENQKMSSKKMAFDQETFQNVQSIKAFGLIEQFSGKMRCIQEEALDLSLRQYRYQSWSGVIVSLTALGVSYACYGFAVYRLWKGDISYGTMTLFLSMASSLSKSFNSVVGLIPTAIRAATSAERVMDIIHLPRETYEDRQAAEKICEEGSKKGVFLRMQDVEFHYKDGRRVYENACLEAGPGEIVALIGPSGQGKTTTLRLFLGLVTPCKGELYAGNPGGDSVEISPSTRCLFAYVPQGNAMFHGTVAENLRMVKPEAGDDELRRVLEAACAWKFVSRLEKGMDTVIGERGNGFSEGQRQRLSIARALLADAPVLLLDEATSALDVATERRVLRNVMRRNPNQTIVVAAHRPSVFSLCSRVYKIEEGMVQEVDEQGIKEFLEAF